jgi:hypothetical protein
MTSSMTKAARSSRRHDDLVAAAHEGVRYATAAAVVQVVGLFLGPWMFVGLARCALLPLFALERLREKSCEDVHDSGRCRRLARSPTDRPVTAVRSHDLPELLIACGSTLLRVR